VPDGTLMWWTSGPRGTDGQKRYASRLATTRSAAGRSGGTWPKGIHFWDLWGTVELAITLPHIACVGLASGAHV
jgi:hypothetical protein